MRDAILRASSFTVKQTILWSWIRHSIYLPYYEEDAFVYLRLLLCDIYFARNCLSPGGCYSRASFPVFILARGYKDLFIFSSMTGGYATSGVALFSSLLPCSVPGSSIGSGDDCHGLRKSFCNGPENINNVCFLSLVMKRKILNGHLY